MQGRGEEDAMPGHDHARRVALPLKALQKPAILKLNV